MSPTLRSRPRHRTPPVSGSSQTASGGNSTGFRTRRRRPGHLAGCRYSVRTKIRTCYSCHPKPETRPILSLIPATRQPYPTVLLPRLISPAPSPPGISRRSSKSRRNTQCVPPEREPPDTCMVSKYLAAHDQLDWMNDHAGNDQVRGRRSQLKLSEWASKVPRDRKFVSALVLSSGLNCRMLFSKESLCPEPCLHRRPKSRLLWKHENRMRCGKKPARLYDMRVEVRVEGK